MGEFYNSATCTGNSHSWMKFKVSGTDCLDVDGSGGTDPPTDFKSLKAVSCDNNQVKMEKYSKPGCSGTKADDTLTRGKSFFKEQKCDEKTKMDSVLQTAHHPSQCSWTKQALVSTKNKKDTTEYKMEFYNSATCTGNSHSWMKFKVSGTDCL